MSFDNSAFWQAAAGGLWGGFALALIVALLITLDERKSKKACYITYLPEARPVLIDDDRLEQLADIFVKSGLYEATEGVATFQHYLDGVMRTVAEINAKKAGLKI